MGRPWLWKAITLVALVVAVGTWVGEFGPYAWMTDLQLQVMGRYFPALTFMGVFALLFVPICIAYAVATRTRRRELGLSFNQAMLLFELSPWRGWGVSSPRLQRLPLGLVVLALILLVMGSWTYYQGWATGSLKDLLALNVERGEDSPSGWVDVEFHALLLDQTIVVEEGSRKKFLVPVASSNWEEGQPLGVFLEFSWQSEIERLRADQPIQGVASKGLPRTVLAAYERDGIALAPAPVVVNVGDDPPTLMRQGRTMLIAGGVVSLLILVVTLWRTLRHRRLALPANQPPH